MLTTSAEETRRLGSSLASLLGKGDVILLSGSLGAGKSELARGIARGLEVGEPVTSPTFTLLNVYQTKQGVPLHHFDWYRINDPEELLVAGLDEFIGGDSITLIEWHERAPDLIPPAHLAVTITPLAGDYRQIDIQKSAAFRALDLIGLEQSP